jgi:hypothetical protein
MELDDLQEREVRAARNQSLFRALNERLRELNESFASLTDRFTITCECADRSCIEMVEIRPDDYLVLRAELRHFAVLPDHVYPDVETIVRENDGYVVVEKIGDAADWLASSPERSSRADGRSDGG